MKLLVIGQGGREHAIVKALIHSPSVSEIHCIPGSDGMGREALCHPLDWKNSEALIGFCVRYEIDSVIIGPEDPLVDGLADRLRERGILVFGPGAQAAQLEGSKIYSKNFMVEAGIPTAKFVVVGSAEEVRKNVSKFTPPYVLKADGLAAGKGVFICDTTAELFEKAQDIFEKQTLGEAGKTALLEQFQGGWEMSYLILTNGHDFRRLPLVQDHKRLQDGDKGPNTGGMGTIAPVPFDDQLLNQIDITIVKPTLRLLEEQGLLYRGVIFLGLMITPDGPRVLEYNVRFGDPETQVLLPLVEGDWGHLFHEVACGRLPEVKLKSTAACCVILAAPGYPDSPKKGVPINGELSFESTSGHFIHAGTKKVEGHWETNGGRVLGAVGFGTTRADAIRNAYAVSEKVSWDGMLKRSDIGSKI